MATWTSSDPRWKALSPSQRAAAMALMEADGMNPTSAKNALGAMLNRSAKTGEPLGDHVSRAIYQPTIEPAQQARLDRILASKAFPELTSWADRRQQGLEEDPVQGATHFLAPEKTMLTLEAGNPRKYRSWRQWTGFDPETQSYKGTILRDGSHAFLAPEGAYSIPAGDPRNVAMNGKSAGADPDSFAGVSGSIHTSIPRDAGVPVSTPPPPSLKLPTPGLSAPSTQVAGAFKMPGLGSVAGGIGAFAQAMGGGGGGEDQAQKANQSMLDEQERAAMTALDLVRKREKLRMKPRMGAGAFG